VWNVIRRRASLIREPNEVRILRLVRDSGEISRIEIARSTRLHKATITDLVGNLIRAGFLEETGQEDGRKSVGRKRILLRFRPLAGVVAGVDIGMTRATVALTDLNASILQQESFVYLVGAPAQEVLSRVAASIETLLEAARFPSSALVGIGIGVQGVIDYRTNTLTLSHNKKPWQGESLSALLETRFNVPVYVENDVKSMALGEYLLGAAKGVQDFVHIWIGEGLGAGVMINGHLLHGITSSAGEIGYNALDFPPFYAERVPLTFRNQVMFGEILTDANFIESYRRCLPEGSAAELTVAGIALSAIRGDLRAQQVIEEFTSLLSMLSINLVNMLNPELILLGGKLAQSYPAIAGMLQDKIRRDLLTPPAEAVRVRTARHGERGAILGAVGLVLYELFEPLHRVPSRSTLVNSEETETEVLGGEE
jgi:predicted NBD/HSP70 family sugar kinase